VDTLKVLQDTLGDRQICVARELSKKFEEFQRGTVSEVLAHFTEQAPRGEIVLVIGGAPQTEPVQWDEAQIRHALSERLAAGDSLSSAARALASESGWERRAIYALGVDE